MTNSARSRRNSRDLERVRRRWLDERPKFAAFGQCLAKRLRAKLKVAGIWGEVSSRAKEVDSLVRKLIKDDGQAYGALSDRSGVRVVVRYKHEIEPVLEIAAKLFRRGDPEYKVESLGFDKVGYLSVHSDIRLKDVDSLRVRYPPRHFHAELQVRSMAQHLWSEMSHDTFYKNDDTLNPLPPLFKRRIHVLAGVIELADDEFTRIEHEMPNVSPEIQLLKALERHYFKLTTRRPDHELSLQLLGILMPLYHSETTQIAAHIDDVYRQHEDVLRHIYDEAESVPEERSAFLYQPEALLVYDLLQADPSLVRRAWSTHFPEKELERLANAFGVSFD
jgi:ppGpp synthetase/RelA/SpoT-type nucleotidyltranferase